ncbi:fanconi-associated nuclease 1 homolog isoform X2 [Asparagus officinalis]|uniref:fanconi-associated nuclease 1 homolog isoform X2 n=1 Tax=Asparagus officinalis TaxID=4686 RepID=UPI00098E0CB2|nr:fanconi-associated nuclease 1 homolog isoform X2 [Asparagus officinalis]
MQRLDGRESLSRLIGKKRKRTLSSPLSLLLQSKSKPNPKEEEEKEAEVEAPSTSNDGKIKGNDDPVWVSCPVCGSSIRGTDHMVNSHLDICLTRGAKKKLTQRTLLQLKFCPISASKTSAGVLDNTRAAIREGELVGGKEISDSEMTIERILSENNEKIEHASGAQDVSKLTKCIDVQMEIKTVENTANENIVPQSTMVPKVDTFGVEDSKVLAAFETFIVGRKFHDNIQLQQGCQLFLSRDPQNAKDKHAIKVLSTDLGAGNMLGYLPRELAKFLSPLMDNHHLKCEGSVISISEHPLDPVPIQLVCEKMVASGKGEHDGQQNFEFLWENVKRVTEYGKLNPPSMTKYQQNFCLMIEEVVNNHTHLFTSEEKLLLGSFDSLSNNAQRLFVRIYTRKGPWFRMSNISYPEISDLQTTSEELRLAGYICSFNCSEDVVKYNIKEVLEVLNVFEMREISNSILSKKGVNLTRRQELIDALFSAYEDETCQLLPKMILERAGTCIKISSAADILFWRVQRLFFLNGEQDFSAFLLSDLGLIKFPQYNCAIVHPIFQYRSDLLEYEESVEVAQIMDESLDENNLEKVMRCINVSHEHIQTSFREAAQSSKCGSPPAFFSRFSASWVYSKVLSLGVSVFERERRYEDAIRLLKDLLSQITRDSRRGYWTLRLSIDLEHINRVNESLAIAEEGVLDPCVRAGSKLALQRRVLRLAKPPRRWKTPSYANSVKRTIKEMAPLDFLTDDFYITRRNLIELHLQKIQKGKAGEILIASWDSHVGTACHGVNWDRHSLSDLRAVVSCIGGSCLASLCRHLALDYRSWCSGMPDLLLWRFHGGDGDAGRAKLVEVKGPRDRLSEQQRAWMLILMDCGFDVEVCKVGSP